MSNLDKNILITPNIGSASSDPKIDFFGADATTGPSTITAVVYPTNNGTLNFQASEGTLFSISNNLSSGSIFSVNPISGIPIIDVNADRTIALNPFGGNTGIGTTNPTSRLYVVGNAYISGNTGIGTTNPTSGLHVVGSSLITGVSTVGNFSITPVGTGATVGGIGVTYYGDGSLLTGISAGGSGEFNTGISSSIQLTPLSYETSIYTFPSTAGKQYVIESINVANVDTSVGVGTTINIIASIEDSSGEQTYIAYNVPITNGGLIELLKNPIVAGPSDVMRMWSTNDAYTGVSNATEVYMNYTEFTSTEYINEYASTVSIATTDPTAVYTSTTYPSTIEAIHFANRTDIGDYPISVSITNGTTTTYLAKNLIIPRYATVDILDRPKRVETNGVIKVEVAQTSTIDVIIAGKQITS